MGKVVGLTFDAPARFLCPHCGKEYKSAAALEKHIAEKHPEQSGDTGQDQGQE